MFYNILNLFWAFIKVGALSFGGAYSLIPIIESEVVKNYSWLSQDEFLKVLGITQVIPGAISIKFATYTGYKVAGILGVLVANLGNLLMPAVLIIVFVKTYDALRDNLYFGKSFEGLKLIIIGMIAGVVYKYAANNDGGMLKYLFFIVGGVLLVVGIHPAYIIGIGALLGVLLL